MKLKLLSSKTLTSLSLPSPYKILISHFSTSQNYPSHSSPRRHEEESKNVRVSVWWDFENCNLPAGVNVFKIAHMITGAIRANNIKGPIQITAFGDVLQLSRANQEALSSTGINLAHVPNGGKNSADRTLLVDLMYWVSQNPPPAHLFLISGDRDFASTLHRLRMNNYNILLASTDTAPSVLCSAASIMWHWHALIRGENLSGRHFNQPPDGPYGSWYGHYRGQLEDPFLVVEQSSCSRIEELSDPGSDSKIRQVPKAVMKQIRHILNSYPKGLSITELRSELNKSIVSIDKDLYGYKKFSRFLLSMPHILKLQSEVDGQFFVRGVTPKAPEPFESSSGISTSPVNKNGDHGTMYTKPNDEDISVTAAVYGKSKVPSSPEVNVDEPSRKVQQLPPIREKVACEKVAKLVAEKPPEEVQQAPPVGEKVVEVVTAQLTEGHLPLVANQDSVSEVGFFKKMWLRWFGADDGGSQVSSHDIQEKCSNSRNNSEKKTSNNLEKCCNSGESSEKTKVKEKSMKPPSQGADKVHLVSFSSSSDDSALDNKTAIGTEAYSDKSSTSPGFLNRIVNWCKFWRSSPNSDTLDDQSSERLSQIDSHFGKHEVFTKDSFWNDMELFMDTPRGSVLVSKSKTREQMAENLRKEGPLSLRSLSNSDILCLVNLLISEKKWVEECPSELSPFKLTWPVGKNSCSGPSHAANGLRSIFLGTASQSNLQKSPEHGEKKFQNISHTGVSSPVTKKKPSDRSRSEILIDCQKLVNEILKEHPEGYHISSFRQLFLERFGYPLAYQKLGYQKLSSLLQIMPGMKIESTFIIPSRKAPKRSGLKTGGPSIPEINASLTLANSDSELSDASKKDDFDSPWEELGPVSNTSSDRKEPQSVLRSKAIEETKRQPYPDYEPSLSDDEFSDSEEETSSLTQPDGHGNTGVNDEDSSLLQILDSWYSGNEGDNRKDKPENVDGIVDCSTNSSKPSGLSGAGSKSETSLGNNGCKQRPQKSYTFVSDSVGNHKDKLIDGILGSLKKSGESRMQS